MNGFNKLNEHGLRTAFALSLKSGMDNGNINELNADDILSAMQTVCNGLMNLPENVALEMNDHGADNQEFIDYLDELLPNYGIKEKED